ncbi:MAG: protein kinase [Lentisphaeria bacterium]|nr:protein kinase [Lentisphaeria bacterium]
MPEYICSSCGLAFEAEPDQDGKIVCTACGQGQEAATARKPLPPGTRIDGFEIIRHIAAGGCGSVYLAEQINMERNVALKILNQDKVGRGQAKQFLKEARNTAKFENPHVVQVIDSGISKDGAYYIAMQYVEGETLEEILRRGRVFSEEETLLVALTVADALRSIWNKYKMFHKDIKPGNIMLTPEKDAMLLDMGTAQERGESKLADGDIEGSPYYMSPEQARGEALNWSTDLYSLGATMYQMVTGKYLYDAPEVEEILRLHDSAPIPDAAAAAPQQHISEAMSGLLKRMLGKKPADRFASWDEFIVSAQKLLKSILENKKQEFSSSIRQQYDQLFKAHVTRPVLKRREQPSTTKFVCLGLIIFILIAALAGGIVLYMAIRKNSGNARALLEQIQKQTEGLQMDPDAAEDAIRQAEPYFNRLGVLPSLRDDLEQCKKRVADFRSMCKEEEKLINSLESKTADSLKEADEALILAAEAQKNRNFREAVKQFNAALSSLKHTLGTVQDQKFVLAENRARAEQLIKRLHTARRAAQREQMLFKRKADANRGNPRNHEKTTRPRPWNDRGADKP